MRCLAHDPKERHRAPARRPSIRKAGFAAAADELGLSPAYVSKRIQILETTLATRLLHRTSRRIALTEDGERVQRWAVRILEDFQQLSDELSEAHDSPSGRLHLCSSFGFGRNHVAPALSLLAERYPALEIRLDLFDRVVDIVSEGFDLEIRVGDDIPGQHIGRRLVSNRRVLCAAPAYTPQQLEDLEQHDCLVLKERDNAFGIWNLECDGRQDSVRVRGPLSSNSGEIVLQWALDARGILLRSLWLAVGRQAAAGAGSAGAGAARAYPECECLGGIPDAAGLLRQTASVCGVPAGAFPTIVDLIRPCEGHGLPQG